MQQTPEKAKVVSRLNPNIASVEIGIRSIRKIKIYPLSIADQLEFTDLITDTLQTFFKEKSGFEGEESDMQFVNFMLTVIKENLGKILEMVTSHVSE